MRIGIIVDNEFHNDVRVTNEVRHLQRKGHELFVLCFNFGNKASIQNENFIIKKLPIQRKLKDILFASINNFPFYDLYWAYQIRKFIQEHKLEVIHVHDLYMARSGNIAKRKFNIPLVVDLHEN
ncbi:MAG: glycosyltransferase [Bacteroidales bacterium]|nr:glycosyltransferase [Bacteroidales bacterium]